MSDGAAGVDVFCSYSSKDEQYREQLSTHLSILRRRGVVKEWHFRKIGPGQDWDRKIRAELERAQVVLVLVSSDFVASDYCYDVELKRALERRSDGECEVLPIIVRPVDTDGTPLHKLQALPTDKTPISLWDDLDEAWVSVTQGLKLVCESLGRLSGDPHSALEDELKVSEEDFGILDFVDEFMIAMDTVSEVQARYASETQKATDSMTSQRAEIADLAANAAPDMHRKGRRVAAAMGAGLASYANHIEAAAKELDEAWSRVDRYFPRMFEAASSESEEEHDELTDLLDTLDTARGNVAELAQTIEGTSSQLDPLGAFSANLKIGVRRAQRSLGQLRDVYWRIGGSLDHMMARIKALLDD